MKINSDLIIEGTGKTLGDVQFNDWTSPYPLNTEVKTKETWENGQPIYRKTFYSLVGQGTFYTIDHNLNLAANKMWIDQAHSWWTNGTYTQPLGHYQDSNDFSRCYLGATTAGIAFGNTYNTHSKAIYLTICYVKS